MAYNLNQNGCWINGWLTKLMRTVYTHDPWMDVEGRACYGWCYLLISSMHSHCVLMMYGAFLHALNFLYCVTNYQECIDLTYRLSHSSSCEESSYILAGFSASLQSRCWLELGSLLGAGLGKGLLSSSVRMLSEFISLWLQDSWQLISSNSVKREDAREGLLAT